jgi:hypothetical protein
MFMWHENVHGGISTDMCSGECTAMSIEMRRYAQRDMSALSIAARILHLMLHSIIKM